MFFRGSQWGRNIIYRNTEEVDLPLNIEFSGNFFLSIAAAHGRPTTVFACSSQLWDTGDLRVKYPSVTNVERTIVWTFMHVMK